MSRFYSYLQFFSACFTVKLEKVKIEISFNLRLFLRRSERNLYTSRQYSSNPRPDPKYF